MKKLPYQFMIFWGKIFIFGGIWHSFQLWANFCNGKILNIYLWTHIFFLGGGGRQFLQLREIIFESNFLALWHSFQLAL